MADSSTAVALPKPAENKQTSQKQPQQPAGSVKETIESILVAFILAFVFRAFVVEAFVIPTGSMAPTLLGAHMRFRCEDCGYEFDVNYSPPGDNGGDDINIPSQAYVLVSHDVRDANGKLVRVTEAQAQTFHTLRCPNCGYRVPREAATGPPVYYGDRILVLKYVYLFKQPQRWDVVVFKSPEYPTKFDYSQNYIKRLVGRPGETILILDGDVYVGKDGKDFEVQTKPYIVQQAMWRIVYDNDYQPTLNADGRHRTRSDQPDWRQPWTTTPNSTGWALTGPGTDNGRVFRFDQDHGSGTIFFDATAAPRANHFTDYLAYDEATGAGDGRGPDIATAPSNNFIPVSDVKLDLFYQRQSGDGPLRLKVTKYGRTFVAEIAPQKISLLEQKSDGSQIALSSRDFASPSSRPMHVELANVDYRVWLRIDGDEMLATTPAQYKPDVDALLRAGQDGPRPSPPSVQIEPSDQHCALSHVSLWRDVYYTNPGPDKWATPKNPMKLKADEFFVLGDNSRVSNDARYWMTPIHLPDEDLDVDGGRVPGRFLLGKAFFVYWPAGYRPFSDRAPGVVPNFGKMRFIH